MRIKTSVLFIIIILIGCTYLQAGVILKGRVISSTGLPVSQAQVTLENLVQPVSTDEQGLFSLEIPVDQKRVKVRIKHPDYFEQEFSVGQPQAGKVYNFF